MPCPSSLPAPSIVRLAPDGTWLLWGSEAGAHRVRAMSSQTVQVAVGPVDADVALVWIRHWQHVLEAIAVHADELSIQVKPPDLQRVRALLGEWAATAASSTTFWWRQVTTDDELRPVVDQWLAIGDLTADDHEQLGTTWAPEDTRPMREAVIAGVSAALVALGEQGRDLRNQIEP